MDYDKVSSYKEKLLDAAFARFQSGRAAARLRRRFCKSIARGWIPTPASSPCGGISKAIVVRLAGRPAGFARPADSGVPIQRSELACESIERERFCQYVFYRQYLRLKRYCNDQGIQVVGDVPIYVAYDSADVWSHPDLFKLTRDKKPRFVAGVPPDYFSATGPALGQSRLRLASAWKRRASHGGSQRMKHNLLLFDFVRIDHFRGLVAYWEVPASHKTAMRGKWVQVPHDQFFRELFRQIPFAAIFVEDLGYITADVREVVAKHNFPRMVVLQFAFGGDPARNPYMPHNYVENSIVYTGTHDNNTTRGWFEKDLKRRPAGICSTTSAAGSRPRRFPGS